MFEGGSVTEEGGSSGRELAVVPSSSACFETPLLVRDASPNYHSYPSPDAKYEDVAADPKLFRDTLEKLHKKMGTKFMIPTIGGKELDLHRLFVEVTSRGGIEKVIRERRWKDITAVFNFPSTATNASFVLRKYYVSLIHHYEQIYFFGAQGWVAPSSAPSPSPSPAPVVAEGLVEPMLPPTDVQETANHKRMKSTGEFLPGGIPKSSTGCPVVGVIDGKFEYGYLVTVTVGTEKLKGILYHIPEHPVGQVPRHSGTIADNSSKDTAGTVVHRRRRRKKSEMRKRDPAHPKPNRSGYNFFFAEQHARLKPLHPGKDKEISKMIGFRWNKLTETEKAVYQEKGLKDKERYRSEMEEYRERLKTDQVISTAVPIQQRLAVPEATMVQVDPKIDAEEGGSPRTLENESSSGESDSEEKTADKDSEMEASLGSGNGIESTNVATNMPAEVEGSELQRGDQEAGEERKLHQSNMGDMSQSIKKESVSTDGH